MTPQVLESYLADYGWAFRKVSETNWVTGWQGGDRSYPLVLTLSDTWLSFEVKPFLKLSLDWDIWPELSLFLLELNHSSHMVKLVVDESGDICLHLEMFTNELIFSNFADSLGLIGYYCDQMYDQILNQLDRIGCQTPQDFKYLT